MLAVIAATIFILPAHAGWIDTKTGKPVSSWPVLVNNPNDYTKGVRHVRPETGDRKHAFDPETGRNFALNGCGDWIDTKTGKPVSSWPVLMNDPNDYAKGVHHVLPAVGDSNHAFDPETGRNFARVLCPPSTAKATPPVKKSKKLTAHKKPKPSVTRKRERQQDQGDAREHSGTAHQP